MTDYKSTNRRYLTTRQTRALVEGEAINETGDETIAGVKTFTSSPIVPAPTTDMQAATKKYVDDNAGGSEVVSDTTPQLGGDLDTNDHDIVFSDELRLREADPVNFEDGVLLLDGATATTANRAICAVGGLHIAANTGADGMGDWVPSLSLNTDGSIQLAAKADRVIVLNGYRLDIGTTLGTKTNGDIEIESPGDKGLILKSPDNTRYRVTVQNGGTLSVEAVV